MQFWSSLSPAAKTLGATVAFAYAGQATVALGHALPNRSEKYYDLAGSLGFISCTALSLYFPHLRARWTGQAIKTPFFSSLHPRQILMTSAVTLWAGRLGTFLFQRIRKHGSDSRFDDIKPNPFAFFGAWMAQATWITLTAFPVYAINALGSKLQNPLTIRDYAGFTIWICAFLFEVTADRQKSAWREARDKKEHDEKFISSGLWSISRHPNYVGEVMMWVGLSLASQSVLSTSAAKGALGPYARYVALLSPIFEFALIRLVSGVPMLEKSADQKFSDDKAYQKYKDETPVFWPKLF